MGIIQKLFGYKSRIHLSRELDENQNRINENQIDYIVKIHICGNSERKKKVIDLLFNNKIKDERLKTRGDNEFRTADFYWITKIYKDEELINDNFIRNMEENIIRDKTNNQELKIKHHIMLCFGNDIDLNIVLKNFSSVNLPRIIIVNDKGIEINNSNKKKYVTNIICNNMDDRELNKYILSSLWELDCYFNEKGNQKLRNVPANIVKEMNIDNSFFSINILLTGMSRAGKSTFINLLSGKLVALETNDAQSITLKFSQYYKYREDNKKEHGALKLIDTPGICENEEVNLKTYEILNDYVKNEKKEIEKQLHFILFFFIEDNPLGNSERILKLLNDNDYPVFFIINKSFDDSDDGRSRYIQSTILFLRRNNCNNLTNPDNFIQVNIKKNNKFQPFYGVDNIFKKIEKYINDKKLLDKGIIDKMNKFQDDFRLSQFPGNNDKDIDKVKNEIKDFCNEITNENLLFRKINLENIKEHGRKISIDLVKNIIILSKLRNVFPEKINNLPIISFLQAYMIKEIGGGYGFDFSSVSFCFKKFDKDISKFKELNFINRGNENENGNQLIPNNNEKIEVNREELNLKINNMYNTSDHEVIERLVKRIHEITSKINNKQRDEDEVNTENIIAISDLCQKYFEEELDATNGLPFFIYYYKKNVSLMEDIKYYSEKKEWEKDEIEIIKK